MNIVYVHTHMNTDNFSTVHGLMYCDISFCIYNSVYMYVCLGGWSAQALKVKATLCMYVFLQNCIAFKA
jgi:hypothetical protein